MYSKKTYRPNPNITTKGKSIVDVVNDRENNNNKVRMSASAYKHLEMGLNATLGSNHGFSLNGAILTYNAPENNQYNDTQQAIIDRLVYLIGNEQGVNINVAEVSRDQELPLSNGNTFTLNEARLNGVTLTDTDPETHVVSGTIKIFLADNILLDGETQQPDYMKGVNALHELAGHAYLRLSNTGLTAQGNAPHNRTTESFVTRLMQIYKIGVIRDKAHANHYNKNFLKPLNKKRAKQNLPPIPLAEPGDPQTLVGKKASRHLE